MKTKEQHIKELAGYKLQHEKLLAEAQELQEQLGISTVLTQWKIKLMIKEINEAIKKCQKIKKIKW